MHQIWTVNQASQSDRPKETRKKSPIKVTQTATRLTQQPRDLPSESASVSTHPYCTLSPPNDYFSCFTTFHFCGNSFPQSRRTRAHVSDHWSSG